MIYCLWIGYVILKSVDMVFLVKLLFLKYNIFCDIFDVFEM